MKSSKPEVTTFVHTTKLPQVSTFQAPFPQPLIRPLIESEWKEIDDDFLKKQLEGNHEVGVCKTLDNSRFSDGMIYIENEWMPVSLEFEAEMERRNPTYLSAMLSKILLRQYSRS